MLEARVFFALCVANDVEDHRTSNAVGNRALVGAHNNAVKRSAVRVGHTGESAERRSLARPRLRASVTQIAKQTEPRTRERKPESVGEPTNKGKEPSEVERDRQKTLTWHASAPAQFVVFSVCSAWHICERREQEVRNTARHTSTRQAAHAR